MAEKQGADWSFSALLIENKGRQRPNTAVIVQSLAPLAAARPNLEGLLKPVGPAGW